MKKASEKRRLQLLLHDQQFLDRGFTSLAGVDEAGCGPLAGPVVASAVIVRDVSFLTLIDDSKKMTPEARAKACDEILAKCQVGIGVVEHDEIDRINIYQAAMKAMMDAVAKLGEAPECLLIDGNRSPRLPFTQFAIIDGDRLSFSIACASIVAKVMRDRMMEYYDELYPKYGFRNHKGYGTKEHLSALREHGPCEIHRKTFDPVKRLMTNVMTKFK